MEQAYTEYAARQARRSRPPIKVLNANGKRIVTQTGEHFPCCEGHNINIHIRSAKHIAHVFGLDPKEFTLYVRLRRIRETVAKRRAA